MWLDQVLTPGIYHQLLDTRLRATDHPSLSLAAKPVFDPLHCLLIQSAHRRLLYEDVTGDNVKSQVDNIHCSFLIHQTSHLIVEGYQVDQARLCLCEAMLRESFYFFQFLLFLGFSFY